VVSARKAVVRRKNNAKNSEMVMETNHRPELSRRPHMRQKTATARSSQSKPRPRVARVWRRSVVGESQGAANV